MNTTRTHLHSTAADLLRWALPALLAGLVGCTVSQPGPAVPAKPRLTTIQNNVPIPSGMDFYTFLTRQNQLGNELQAQATRPGLTPEQQGQEMVRLTKRAIASGRIQKGVTCLVYGTDGQLLWNSQSSDGHRGAGGRAEFEQELQKKLHEPGSTLQEFNVKYPDGTSKTFRR